MDAHDLYGLPLERFIPERKALAKALRAEGRRDEADTVAALRKPSLAAWGVNQLVRTQGRDVSALFSAGDEARDAQAALLAQRGDGATLRKALDRERAAAERLARAARGLLSSEGHALSQVTLERITETLHAAALEPEARAQVENGCLDRELRHVGLEAAGLGDEPGPRPARKKRAGAPTAALRKREADARRAADRAARDVRAAEDRANAAVDELAAAKDALTEARRTAREAETAHRRAQRDLESR